MIIRVGCLFGTVELQRVVLLCDLQVWPRVWGTTSPCMQWHPQGSALLAPLWSTQRKRVRITAKFLSTSASFKFVKLLWFVKHNFKVHHYEMESFVLSSYLLADYCLQIKLTHLLYSALFCSALLKSTLLYSTVIYSTLYYSTRLYSILLCSPLYYSTLL